MSDYNDELMRYEDAAEDQYDDFDNDEDMYDDEEDDFETGFDGLEDGYDEEYEDEYDGFIDEGGYDEDMYDDYSKTSIGKIDPNDRTLTVVVANTSGAAAEAVVFGGNAESAQPAGVTVVVEESSHKEVREESKSNPFKIAGMKYSVSNPLQFDNVLRIDRRTASGSKTTRVYQPRNATSPQNFSQSLIDDDNFEMDVTGQDSLRLMIEDGVTAVFTFTIKARANIGNLLKGGNVAELSRAPRTTGLPQLDLLRRSRPTALGLRPKRPVRRFRKRTRPTRNRRRIVRRPASTSRRPVSRLVRRRRR
ncbi:hypothetical protein [Flavivirga rizhaonensis]|uniref:Uncharacterized protein n=1 Tax=Flavivirga rizhaonensis TaxID=2559571 RepID=A0A4S1DZD9_9FLAO|nr:hypothetical protein [Flavivirga rizhaonensis]TGV03626.1 hypothetical protein EM932_06265 [Flavivirga rizhaonensis]